MRAFLAAVVTCIVIAVAASFVLETYQTSADIANTTIGTRLDAGQKGSRTQ